ncbi:MAG TPA: hypothetical protein VGU20_24465 [Stellaceae bacterium]|nr:hypothetical protein [Stellaceae bacterium]
MRQRLLRATALGVLALLVACSSRDKDKAPDCPSALIAPNLDSYTLARPDATNPQDIQFGVKLASATANCHREKGGVRVDTAISFVVIRTDPQFRNGDFTYFVAIADRAQNIVAKENFALRAAFAPKQDRMRVTDTITEHLPLKDPASAGSYVVLVGLQLSQQQLESNRQRNAPAQ